MNVVAYFMAVVLTLTLSVGLAWAEDTDGEARRVVILNATDPYLPAFLALDSA